MGKGKDTAIWSEIGWAAAVLSALVVLYTIGIALASLDQLFGWLNTLLATMLSEFCTPCTNAPTLTVKAAAR